MEKYSQSASPCDRHERKDQRRPCRRNPIRFDLEAHERRDGDRAQIARELWSFELALPVRKIHLAGLQSPICVEKRERQGNHRINTRADLARLAAAFRLTKKIRRNPERNSR